MSTSSADVVHVGDLEIELVHTPGHTPGSQCFSVAGRLVSGDTLFLEGCGRTDLPGGDPEQMYESITTRLRALWRRHDPLSGSFLRGRAVRHTRRDAPEQLRVQAAVGRAVALDVRFLRVRFLRRSLESVVIVGASLAGMRAAATLRDEGYTGTLVVVGDEAHAPYDRPPLSKQFLAGKWDESRISLVAPGKIDELGLDIRLGRRAESIDIQGHEIVLDDGSSLQFDKAVIATGSHPRSLPGVQLSDTVMTLRTLDDSRRLASAIRPGTRLVVVGGGFIGSEVAATASSLGASVTVLEALAVPLGRVLGDRLGAASAALHEAHDVHVRTGTGVTGITQAKAGPVVSLDDGSTIQADVVVIGIGIVPTTGWLEGSGLELDDGLVVDSTLHATDDVLAAGDVARWPDVKLAKTVPRGALDERGRAGRDSSPQPPGRTSVGGALRHGALHLVGPVRREDPGAGRPRPRRHRRDRGRLFGRRPVRRRLRTLRKPDCSCRVRPAAPADGVPRVAQRRCDIRSGSRPAGGVRTLGSPASS